MEGGGGGCWSWMRDNFGQRSREQDGSERQGRSCTRVINACVVCRRGSSGPAKQADTRAAAELNPGIFCFLPSLSHGAQVPGAQLNHRIHFISIFFVVFFLLLVCG